LSTAREIRSSTVKAFCAHHETNDPVATIKQLAGQLVSRSGQASPPYEPAAMLPFAPISLASSIKRVVMTDDADIRIVDSQLQIFLNADKSELRNRFSLAHELGHTFFLPFRNEIGQETLAGTTFDCQDIEEERLCNIAAAEILMPEYDMRRKINRMPPTPALLKQLAATFTVSQQSMAVRVCGLTGFPVVTGAIGTDTVHSKQGLRLLWYSKSAVAEVQKSAPILCSETKLPEAISAGERPFAYGLSLDCGEGPAEWPASFAPLSSRGQSGVLFSAIVELRRKRLYRDPARRRRRA